MANTPNFWRAYVFLIFLVFLAPVCLAKDETPNCDALANVAVPQSHSTTPTESTRRKEDTSKSTDVAIMPTFWLNRGSWHVDIQLGDSVWNAKRGWKPYASYKARRKLAERTIRENQTLRGIISNWATEKKKIAFNSGLKPMFRVVLDLTPEQKTAVENWLNERKDKKRFWNHTCVNATCEMLSDVLDVQVPPLQKQVPELFARWLLEQSKSEKPVLKIKELEWIGNFKEEHLTLSKTPYPAKAWTSMYRGIFLAGLPLLTGLGGGLGYLGYNWFNASQTETNPVGEVPSEEENSQENTSVFNPDAATISLEKNETGDFVVSHQLQ